MSITDPLTEKPSIETVRNVFNTVLSHDINADRKGATEWLENLRSSIHAWEICNQLLASNEGIEVNYLAAHMLRQKISKNFNELPIECYSSLKDSILNHLQNNDDYAVQGQLTAAIADLTLLLQTWQNPIEELAKQLGLDMSILSISASDLTSIYRSLHNRLIFGYIMHQMCDLNHHNSERPCRVGAKRREEYEDYLVTKCDQAISWWLNTLNEANELKKRLMVTSSDFNNFQQKQQDDGSNQANKSKCIEMTDKLIGQIYLCYSAWLRILDDQEVNNSLNLIDSALADLKNLECSDHIHKYAVEVIVATASFCEDKRSADYLISHLVAEIYKLEPVFRESVSKEDLEKSSNLVRAFTHVAGIACLTHVIINRDFRLVELLLSCLNHYEFEVVEETYSFWWVFLEQLQDRVNQNDYGPFIAYINRFVMSLVKLCQFDPDEDSVIADDQDIHAFRKASSEIICNAMFTTTVEDFLRDNAILDHLRVDLTKVSWEKVEAILYLLTCLTQQMTKTENHLRRQVFECIVTQQSSNQPLQTIMTTRSCTVKIGTASGEVHPQIVATSLKVIGQLDNFLTDNPEYLALAVNYILGSIGNMDHRKQMMKFAAEALANVMEMNASKHFSNCPDILMIVKDLCVSLDDFDKEASKDLLKSAAYLASAIQDRQIQDQFLCQIITPSINALQLIVNEPSSPSTMKLKNEPPEYFDRLSTVFRQTSIQPSLVTELNCLIHLVSNELWPVIIKIFEMYVPKNEHAIEKACRTLRYIIRCLKPEWLIQSIAETMINLYRSCPQNSSPLYICSILVDEFANKSPEINQGLFNMLEIFCALTFTLLNMGGPQQKSLLSMKSYPETIDDMMRLFKRFMRKSPADFVNCKALESIIELSISSLRIDHQEANQNVCHFVNDFIELGQRGDYPHITDAIRNVLGARITDAIIRACLFELPYYMINDEAQILMTLNSFDKCLFSSWVEATVSSLPKTNMLGIESVTTDQLMEFKQTITNVCSVKKIVNDLRAFARQYN